MTVSNYDHYHFAVYILRGHIDHDTFFLVQYGNTVCQLSQNLNFKPMNCIISKQIAAMSIIFIVKII